MRYNGYVPFHLTYVFRKVKQYKEIMKLPKEKRPTEYLFWVAPQSKLEEFLERVFEGKENKSEFVIDESEIM